MGLANITTTSIISFLIGAILAVILLASKKKTSKEYMSFGPAIVISAFINIFVPFETILYVIRMIFTLGMYKK